MECGPKRGISPRLLIQQNILLYFRWPSAAVWLISCKVPPGSFLHKDFGGAVRSLSCSTFLLVQPGLWGVCGGSHPGRSHFIFPLKFPHLTPRHIPTMLLKESPMWKAHVSPYGGAAVGLSKSSALPCHGHGVFQMKDMKLGTKDGFQLRS